ncbi:DNA polymerase III subunit delta' [Clostridium thermarum]|uniref:DNA polymerase III subunit delta' n=1 Tax=Clostridium thermarum TaxID=1716543 RepID=UPI0011228BF6|nr:DNA polymerase III subunit delta' [Clostridium thermarum]
MRENEIIGHKQIREYFRNAITRGDLSHAHLIIGEEGIGKSLLAKAAAIQILGKEEIKQYIDIIEFRVPKGKKTIGVDEIRSIIEEVSKRPYEGDKKVVILYESNRMTPQAQNAFLKTIEEPPVGVFIFLLADNGEAILDTIKSRCQIHKLNSLHSAEMEQFISKRFPELSPEESKTLLAFANGIPGRCEYFIENEEFKEIRNTTAMLLMDIHKSSESKLQDYTKFLLKYKDRSDEVFDTILSFTRDIIIYKDSNKMELVVNKDKQDFILEVSENFSYNSLEQIVKAVNYARNSLSSNVNPALTFDVMLITMLNS